MTRNRTGHAGLWFDKFCNRWRVETGMWTLTAARDRKQQAINPKVDWLNSFSSERVGQQGEIEESVLRLLRLVHRCGGRFSVCVTESRFVTGLGRNSSVESGLAWHPNLGTPYLAGSAVKGMVRAWAEQNGAGNEVARLLGSPESSGKICFMDALPTRTVKLDVDVMTPHYAGWTEEDPPGDWRSPVPIPFLTTAQHMPFLFAMLPREEITSADLDLALEWLVEALAWAGAGAKTATGYGRMVPQAEATRELEQLLQGVLRAEEELSRDRERHAALSPIERELEDLANEPNVGQQPYRAWLKALDSGRWACDPEQQRCVAERIKAEMQQRGAWKPVSAKKNPAKDRDHQGTLVVLRFL